MANRTKPPKHAVKSLREAARVVQGAFVDDERLPCDIRDDAALVFNDLHWVADWLAGAQKHSCGDSWSRLYRMMLALSVRDEHGYGLVVSELGTCQTCWADLLRLVISKLTAGSMLRAGGADKLADVLAGELERFLMT